MKNKDRSKTESESIENPTASVLAECTAPLQPSKFDETIFNETRHP